MVPVPSTFHKAGNFIVAISGWRGLCLELQAGKMVKTILLRPKALAVLECISTPVVAEIVRCSLAD